MADSSGKNSVQLQQALLREDQIWKTLLASLRTFDKIAMDINIIENGYGTISIVLSADLFQNLSYIRMACLTEDFLRLRPQTKRL